MHSYPFFLFRDPATPELYTLSLHDALPISALPSAALSGDSSSRAGTVPSVWPATGTSEYFQRARHSCALINTGFERALITWIEPSRARAAPITHHQGGSHEDNIGGVALLRVQLCARPDHARADRQR